MASAAPKKSKEQKRPNLLFIMSDQQRADALSIAGQHPFLKTPNLDKLAKGGVYFTNTYTPSPSSGPARGAILTGELVEHSGVYSNSFTDLSNEEAEFTTKPTFDQVLADNGYHSEYHGKWHCPIIWTKCYTGFEWEPVGRKSPNAYRLIQLKNYMSSMAVKYNQSEYKQGVHLYDRHNGAFYTPDPIDGRAVKNSEDFTKSKEDIIATRLSQAHNHGLLHIDDNDSETAYQTRFAIDAIKRASKKDEPFNITLSINFPHPPMLPSPKYHEMYDPDQMPTDKMIVDNYVDSPYRNPSARKNVKNPYADPELVKHMMANYYGLVSEIDDWIGKLLETLEKEGLADNTMIVFISDHGEMLGDHSLSGKGNFFEQACRVPFIINYPGVIKPRVVNENVSTRDLYATILDYLNVEQPVEGDSRTLRPIIEGKKRDKNIEVMEWLVGDTTVPTHLIIKDRWKLMVNYSAENKVTPVLFNAEVNETENLIGKSNPNREQNLAKAEELRADLVEWLAERGSKYSDSIKELKL